MRSDTVSEIVKLYYGLKMPYSITLDDFELASFMREATNNIGKYPQNDQGLYVIPISSRNEQGAFTVLTDGAEDPSVESVWQMLDTRRDILAELTEVFDDVQRCRHLLQSQIIEEYFGSEAVRIHRRENYDSYKESAAGFEREYGRKHREENGKLQNRERGNRDSRTEISQKKVREDAFLYYAVSLSNERVDSLIREYAQPGNTKGNYSQAWIATIDPRDFLKLTVEDETLAKWQPGTKNAWGQEVRELNKEDLKNELQMPYLRIDSSESHSVIGHEGLYYGLKMPYSIT